MATSVPSTRIAISGTSGLIGSALTTLVSKQGHEFTRLVRRSPSTANEAAFNPASGQVDAHALEHHDAFVHLAGEPLAKGRWSKRKREAILTSRVESTRLLARTIANLKHPPSTLLVASGAHFYGHRNDQLLTEEAGLGSGFVPEVVRDWEAAADPARQAGIRVAHLRIGMVISARGGVIPEVRTPFSLGLGVVLGKGTQWWSWVSLADVLGATLHVLANPELKGAINVTAPNPVTAAEFSHTLARVLDRPLFARIPTPILRAALGEKAEVLTMSTRVIPAKLRRTNYRFEHATLEEALRHELRR